MGRLVMPLELLVLRILHFVIGTVMARDDLFCALDFKSGTLDFKLG
jgi:hypothetical protein